MKRIVSVVIVLGVGLFGFLLMEPDVDNVSDAQLSNEHSLMQPIPVKPPFSQPAEISSIKIKNVESKDPVNSREYKWSVDRIEDLDFVKKVYKHLAKGNKIFSHSEIIKFLKKHPKLKKINSRTIMNEGLFKF